MVREGDQAVVALDILDKTVVDWWYWWSLIRIDVAVSVQILVVAIISNSLKDNKGYRSQVLLRCALIGVQSIAFLYIYP